MSDQEIREAPNQLWTASNSGDFATEHVIYLKDAVLDYPQSREGNDSQPFYTVSMMEFWGVKVAHEMQYFAAPFQAGESRSKWLVNMDSPASPPRVPMSLAGSRNS
jgi:hypothetical protein